MRVKLYDKKNISCGLSGLCAICCMWAVVVFLRFCNLFLLNPVVNFAFFHIFVHEIKKYRAVGKCSDGTIC